MKSTNSMYVLPKKLPGGQQGQGHGIVLHDQGEDYQQPKSLGSWVNLVC